MFTEALMYVNEFITNRHASAAVVCIGTKDRIWGPYAYGRLSFFPEAPETQPDTIFDIASLTKVVSTTTLTLMLREKGVLSLDSTIGSLFPEAPPDKHRITITHLLSHTAGFPSHAPLYADPKFVHSEGALKTALAVPLEYEPGSRVVYSCIGFIVLGCLIERITGEPLDQLFQQYIGQPLGLDDTTYRLSAAQSERTAFTEWDPVERRFLQGVVHDENARALGGISGNAGLFSTAADLGVFCRMILSGGQTHGETFLSEESLSLLQKNFSGSNEEPRSIGWVLPSPRRCSAGKHVSRRAIGHTGFTGTSLWIDFERGLYAILLTNRGHPVRTNQAILHLRPRFYNAVWQAYDGGIS